jgi:biopolymer transport protein ExbB
MWTLIFERVWYLKFAWKNDATKVVARWEGRAERKSWEAKQIRSMLLSQASMQINQFMPMIKAMVALCPLLGLLGTVWGMIEVFNVMAVTGGGDAKSMAEGVQKATIPTMAGMVAALSGVFANTYVTRIAQREGKLLWDNLTTDH